MRPSCGRVHARYAIALGADAVALKSRQAAVSDTYANQGARAGAILPFTSATASLCAAVTVAVVELLPIIPSVFAQQGGRLRVPPLLLPPQLTSLGLLLWG